MHSDEGFGKILVRNEGRERRKMSKALETLAVVHTHTYTHTDILLKNDFIDFMACQWKIAGFVFDAQKLIDSG